jgi:hypothetical protein
MSLRARNMMVGGELLRSVHASSLTFFLTGSFPTNESTTKFRTAAKELGFHTKHYKTSVIKVLADEAGYPAGIAGGRMYLLTHEQPLQEFTPERIGMLEKLLGKYDPALGSKAKELDPADPALYLLMAKVEGTNVSREGVATLFSRLRDMHALPGEELVDYKRVMHAQLTATMVKPMQNLVQTQQRALKAIPDVLSKPGSAMSSTLRGVAALRTSEAEGAAGDSGAAEASP